MPPTTYMGFGGLVISENRAGVEQECVLNSQGSGACRLGGKREGRTVLVRQRSELVLPHPQNLAHQLFQGIA